VLIEQAIFTSAQTSHRDGYQLVSTSSGVHQEDAQELSSWGPSHDSLLSTNTCIGSVNFHRLQSGNFSISKTLPAGFEYSGRGGHEIYTHFLIVSPELLERFANDPFRLLEAASASGKLNVLQEIPEQLDPFSLPGRVSPVDNSMLQELINDFGAVTLAYLIQQALYNKTFGVCGVKRTDNLFAGMLNLLPPACRRDYSFTTGLKFSPRRDYRWLKLPEDQTEFHRLQRQTELAIVNLAKLDTSSIKIQHGWAELILDVLEQGRLDELSDLYGLLPASIQSEELEQCASDMAESKSMLTDANTKSSLLDISASGKTSSHSTDTHSTSNSTQQAHAAHPTFAGSQQNIAPKKANSGSQGSIDLHCGWLMDNLTQLDDVVFNALDGKEKAIEELQAIWPLAIKNLAPDLLEESREEYLRYALSSWAGREENQGENASQLATTALNVLSLLFNEIDKPSAD